MRRGAPPLESRPRMVLPFRILCSLWIALLLALSGSASIAAEDATRQVLDATRAALNDIDVAMKPADLKDSDLARLRAENDPLAAKLQAVIADLTPRLEASGKRLVELTPKA